MTNFPPIGAEPKRLSIGDQGISAEALLKSILDGKKLSTSDLALLNHPVTWPRFIELLRTPNYEHQRKDVVSAFENAGKKPEQAAFLGLARALSNALKNAPTMEAGKLESVFVEVPSVHNFETDSSSGIEYIATSSTPSQPANSPAWSDRGGELYAIASSQMLPLESFLAESFTEGNSYFVTSTDGILSRILNFGRSPTTKQEHLDLPVFPTSTWQKWSARRTDHNRPSELDVAQAVATLWSKTSIPGKSKKTSAYQVLADAWQVPYLRDDVVFRLAQAVHLGLSTDELNQAIERLPDQTHDPDYTIFRGALISLQAGGDGAYEQMLAMLGLQAATDSHLSTVAGHSLLAIAEEGHRDEVFRTVLKTVSFAGSGNSILPVLGKLLASKPPHQRSTEMTSAAQIIHQQLTDSNPTSRNLAARSMLLFVNQWSTADADAIADILPEEIVSGIAQSYDRIPSVARQHLQQRLRSAVQMSHSPIARHLLMILAEHWTAEDVSLLGSSDTEGFAHLVRRIAPEMSRELRAAMANELLETLYDSTPEQRPLLSDALLSISRELPPTQFDELVAFADAEEIDISEHLLMIAASHAERTIRARATEAFRSRANNFSEDDIHCLVEYASGVGFQFTGSEAAAQWLYDARIPPPLGQTLVALGLPETKDTLKLAEKARRHYGTSFTRYVLEHALQFNALPESIREQLSDNPDPIDIPLLVGRLANATFPVINAETIPVRDSLLISDLRDQVRKSAQSAFNGFEQAEDRANSAKRAWRKNLNQMARHAEQGVGFFDRVYANSVGLINKNAYHNSNEGQFKVRQQKSVAKLYETEAELSLAKAQLALTQLGFKQLDDAREVLYWSQLHNYGDISGADTHSISMLGDDARALQQNAPQIAAMLGLRDTSTQSSALRRLRDAGILEIEKLPDLSNRNAVFRFLRTEGSQHADLADFALSELDYDQDLAAVQGALIAFEPQFEVITRLASKPDTTQFNDYVSILKSRSRDLRRILDSDNPLHQGAQALYQDLASIVIDLEDNHPKHPALPGLQQRTESVRAYLDLVDGDSGAGVRQLLDFVASDDFDSSTLGTWLRQNGTTLTVTVSAAVAAGTFVVMTAGTGLGVLLFLAPGAAAVSGFTATEVSQATLYGLRSATRRKDGSSAFALGAGDSMVRMWLAEVEVLNENGELESVTFGDVLGHSAKSMGYQFLIGVATAGIGRFMSGPALSKVADVISRNPRLLNRFRARIDRLMQNGTAAQKEAFARSFTRRFLNETGEEISQEAISEKLIEEALNAVDGRLGALTPFVIAAKSGFSLDAVSAHLAGNVAGQVYRPKNPEDLRPLVEFFMQEGFQVDRDTEGRFAVREPGAEDAMLLENPNQETISRKTEDQERSRGLSPSDVLQAFTQLNPRFLEEYPWLENSEITPVLEQLLQNDVRYALHRTGENMPTRWLGYNVSDAVREAIGPEPTVELVTTGLIRFSSSAHSTELLLNPMTNEFEVIERPTVVASNATTLSEIKNETLRKQLEQMDFPPVDPSIHPEMRIANRQVAQVLQNVVRPEDSPTGKPVEVIVADSMQTNAMFYEDDHGQRYVVVSLGLLAHVENDDELAFVIGHELEHGFSKIDPRGDREAYKEDMLRLAQRVRTTENEVDIRSIFRIAQAGYNPHAGVSFTERMRERFGDAPSASHTMNSMRLDSLNVALTTWARVFGGNRQFRLDSESRTNTLTRPILDELLNTPSFADLQIKRFNAELGQHVSALDQELTEFVDGRSRLPQDWVTATTQSSRVETTYEHAFNTAWGSTKRYFEQPFDPDFEAKLVLQIHGQLLGAMDACILSNAELLSRLNHPAEIAYLIELANIPIRFDDQQESVLVTILETVRSVEERERKLAGLRDDSHRTREKRLFLRLLEQELQLQSLRNSAVDTATRYFEFSGGDISYEDLVRLEQGNQPRSFEGDDLETLQMLERISQAIDLGSPSQENRYELRNLDEHGFRYHRIGDHLIALENFAKQARDERRDLCFSPSQSLGQLVDVTRCQMTLGGLSKPDARKFLDVLPEIVRNEVEAGNSLYAAGIIQSIDTQRANLEKPQIPHIEEKAESVLDREEVYKIIIDGAQSYSELAQIVTTLTNREKHNNRSRQLPSQIAARKREFLLDSRIIEESSSPENLLRDVSSYEIMAREDVSLNPRSDRTELLAVLSKRLQSLSEEIWNIHLSMDEAQALMVTTSPRMFGFSGTDIDRLGSSLVRGLRTLGSREALIFKLKKKGLLVSPSALFQIMSDLNRPSRQDFMVELLIACAPVLDPRVSVNHYPSLSEETTDSAMLQSLLVKVAQASPYDLRPLAPLLYIPDEPSLDSSSAALHRKSIEVMVDYFNRILKDTPSLSDASYQFWCDSRDSSTDSEPEQLSRAIYRSYVSDDQVNRFAAWNEFFAGAYRFWLEDDSKYSSNWWAEHKSRQRIDHDAASDLLDDATLWGACDATSVAKFYVNFTRSKREPNSADLFDFIWEKRNEPGVHEILLKPEIVRHVFHAHHRRKLARWQLNQRFRIDRVRSRPRKDHSIRQSVHEIRAFVASQFPAGGQVRNDFVNWIQEAILTNRRETQMLNRLRVAGNNYERASEIEIADTGHAIAAALNNNTERMGLYEYLQGMRTDPPEIDIELMSEKLGFEMSRLTFGEDREATRDDLHRLLLSARLSYQQADPVTRALYLHPLLGPDALLASENHRTKLVNLVLGPNAQNSVFRKLFDTYQEALPVGERTSVLAYMLAQVDELDCSPLKTVLEAMGSLGIKAGQFLRTSGMLPEEQRAELDDFFDKAIEPSRDQIFDALDRAFGANMENIKVGRLLGSGSINYVVEGWIPHPRTQQDERVVIRVRRDTARGTVENENQVIRRVIRILESDPDAEVQQAARIAKEALDYAYSTISTRELDQKTERIRNEFAVSAYERTRPNSATGLRTTVVEPRPALQALVSPHMQDAVSIYEAVPSTPLAELPVEQKAAVATQIVEAELDALFKHHLFDPDGHPGNWLIDTEGDRLVRIDTAQLTRISESDLYAFRHLILGLAREPSDPKMHHTILRHLESIFSMNPSPTNLSSALQSVLEDPGFPGAEKFHERLLFLQEKLTAYYRNQGMSDFTIRLRSSRDGSAIQAAFSSIARTRRYLEEFGEEQYRQLFAERLSFWAQAAQYVRR